MSNYDLTYEGSEVQSILDTGDKLKADGYILMGGATPSTLPGTPTKRVAYIGGPGSYSNFGTTTVVPSGSIGVFKYTGSAWSNEVIACTVPISTSVEDSDASVPTGKAVKTAVDAVSGAVSDEATAREEADSALQTAINNLGNKLAEGYVYVGIATPTTNPGTPAGKVLYIATAAGTYTNFLDSGSAALVLTQGINILKFNGTSWAVEQVWGVDDEPTAGSDNLVKSGGVFNDIMTNGSAFDLSAYNNGTTYADLDAALTALNALPAAYKKGGMSMKFVLTSDNKYVQYRLMADNFSITEADWQGVDDEPTAGSENLVKSGGVANEFGIIVKNKVLGGDVTLLTNDNAAAGDVIYFNFTRLSTKTAILDIYNTNDEQVARLGYTSGYIDSNLVIKGSYTLPENFGYIKTATNGSITFDYLVIDRKNAAQHIIDNTLSEVVGDKKFNYIKGVPATFGFAGQWFSVDGKNIKINTTVDCYLPNFNGYATVYFRDFSAGSITSVQPFFIGGYAQVTIPNNANIKTLCIREEQDAYIKIKNDSITKFIQDINTEVNFDRTAILDKYYSSSLSMNVSYLKIDTNESKVIKLVSKDNITQILTCSIRNNDSLVSTSSIAFIGGIGFFEIPADKKGNDFVIHNSSDFYLYEDNCTLDDVFENINNINKEVISNNILQGNLIPSYNTNYAACRMFYIKDLKIGETYNVVFSDEITQTLEVSYRTLYSTYITSPSSLNVVNGKATITIQNVPNAETLCICVPNISIGVKLVSSISIKEEVDNLEVDNGILTDYIPNFNNGHLIISNPIHTYSHSSSIQIGTNYIFIAYHGAEEYTQESYNANAMLIVIDRRTMRRKYVTIFDARNRDVIDGYICSAYYNQSFTILSNDIVLMTCGCLVNGEWRKVYKTYNPNTGELSAISTLKLCYNDLEEDFTISNYLTMCNALYELSLDTSFRPTTLDITTIRKYNGYYYTMFAIATSTDRTQTPYVLMRSSDAIHWDAVENIMSGNAGESAIAICNDKIFGAIRIEAEPWTIYYVCDLSGNILKNATGLPQAANAMPSIEYNPVDGKVYVLYNVWSALFQNVTYRKRLWLATIDVTNYDVTVIKDYYSLAGLHYTGMAALQYGDILVTNVENFRGIQSSTSENPVTDINLGVIPLLDFYEEE